MLHRLADPSPALVTHSPLSIRLRMCCRSLLDRTPQTQEEQRYSMGISAKRLEMSTPRFRCTAFATI